MTKYNILLKRYGELPSHEIETNYFEVTGYSHYENIASNVLKFYLLPTNDHGMEELVLRSLIEISDERFSVGGFNKVKVDREVPTPKGNRIDLVIETDEYIIAIENKIRHHLNNDLDDYEQCIQEIDGKNDDKKKLLFLVLSLKKIKSKAEKVILDNSAFKNITYRRFIDQIRKNYDRYLFSANTKFMIFFNEFITSIEKQLGSNMKDEQLTQFFLENASELEELTSKYSEFKSAFIRMKLDELKAMLDGQFNNVSKNWIFQNSILVQDFNFSSYEIAVDTITSIKNYRITIFGRNQQSHEFLRSDTFYELTGIEKKLKPSPKERLEYKTIELNENTENIFTILNELLKKIDNGISQLNIL